MPEYLKIPTNTISLAVSHLTQEITSAEQARSLVSDVSYQIVPGFLESYSIYSTTEILIALLPLSHHRLIDICLPLTLPHNKSQRLLGRYILMDGKLKAVRLRISQEWPVGRCEQYHIPSEIIRYYRQNSIPFRLDEVVIGVFCLQFLRCRIGLLFESQIMHNGALLDIPQKYQYDIVSVLSDIPRDPKASTFNFKQKEIISKLKRLGEQQLVTVVFAGMRIAPSLNICYDKKTFVRQGREETERKHFLGQRSSTFFLSNMDLNISKRLIDQQANNESEETSMLEEEIFEVIFFNRPLKHSQSVPDQESMSLESKRYLNDILGEAEVRLLHLWYIFKTINQGGPFVLTYPFTERTKQLYLELVKLQSYSLTSKEEMIKIYRCRAGDASVRPQLMVYRDISLMVESNPTLFPKLIYVFSDEEEEIKALKNNQKYGGRICNCQHINPIPLQPPTQTAGFSDIQMRKIDQACNYVLHNRLSTVDDILAHFRELNFSKAEIQRCFVEDLPKKIRKVLRPTSIQLFLIHSSAERIVHEVKEAEERLKNIVERHPSLPDEHGKSLKEKVEHTIRLKKRIQAYLKCHRCKAQLPKTELHQCKECHEWLCYECIDTLTRRALTSIAQYQCAICSRACNCSKCLGYDLLQESQGSKPQEMPLDYFECAICQMFGDSCQMTFQCSQCKKTSCYICSLRDKTGSQQAKICSVCSIFNSRNNPVNSFSSINLVPFHSEPSPIEDPPKPSERSNNQSKPLQIGRKESSQPNSCRQKMRIENSPSMQLSRSPGKKDLTKRPCSSSPDTPRKQRKQKSSSRSRSRDRNKRADNQEVQKSDRYGNDSIAKAREELAAKEVLKPLWGSKVKPPIPNKDSSDRTKKSEAKEVKGNNELKEHVESGKQSEKQINKDINASKGGPNHAIFQTSVYDAQEYSY